MEITFSIICILISTNAYFIFKYFRAKRILKEIETMTREFRS